MKVPNSNKGLTVLIILLINSCLCEIKYQTGIETIEDQKGVTSSPVSLNTIKPSEVQYNQQRNNESSSILHNKIKKQIHHRIKKRSCVSRCGRCKIMCAPINPCGRCNRCNTGSYNIPSFNFNTISHVPTIQALYTIPKSQHGLTGTWNTKPINPIATTKIWVKSSPNRMASVKATNTLGITKTNYVIQPYNFVTTTNTRTIPKTSVNPFNLNIMLTGKNNNTTKVSPTTTRVTNYFRNTTNNSFSTIHNDQTSWNSIKTSLNSMKPNFTIVRPPLLNVTKYWGNCNRKTIAKTTKTTVMPSLKTNILQSTKSTAASRTKNTVIPKKISRNTTPRPTKIIPVLGPKTTVKTLSNCNITKTSAINIKCWEIYRRNCPFRTQIITNSSKINQLKPVNTARNNATEVKNRKSDTKFLNTSIKIVPNDVKGSAGKTNNEKNNVISTTKTNNPVSNGTKITKTPDLNRNRTYSILGNDNKAKNGNDVVKNAIQGNIPDLQKVNKNNCPINNNKSSGQPITSHSNRNNIDDVKKLITKTLNKIKNMGIAMKTTNAEEVLHSNRNQSIVSTEVKNDNRVVKNNVEKSTAIQNENVKNVVNTTNTDLQQTLINNGINSNKNLINKTPKEEAKMKNENNGLITGIKEPVTTTKNGENTAKGVLSNKNTTFNEATDVKNNNNVANTETNKIKTDDTNKRPNESPNKSLSNIPSDANKPPANGVRDEATKIKNDNKPNTTTHSKKNELEWINDVKLA